VSLAAVALLAGSGGFWWMRSRPAEPAAPPPAVVAQPSVVPPASAPVEPAAAAPKAPTEEFQAAAQPSKLPSTPSTVSAPPVERPSKKVVTEEPAVAPADLQPMEQGALIRRGMPNVEPPVPLDIPAYAYPTAARGSGRKVNVRVRLLVDENGKVLETEVRDADGSILGFDEAALAAARQVVFQPATRDGIPGKMWTELIFEFSE
jgi:TonB family protein